MVGSVWNLLFAERAIVVAEFIQACTQSPVNLALSVMLVLILLYWIIVILGAVGLDSLDLDLDLDGEPDIDVDLDVDSETSVLHAGVGTSILRFFNIGTVPVLILLSVFVLALWSIGVISYPWVGNWSILLQVLVLVPFSAGALLLTKLLTAPIAVLFRKMKEQEEAEQKLDLIGKRCMIVSLTATHKHGQAEVQTDGAPLRLNVVTADNASVLNKGDEAVLVAKDGTRGVYTIRGFDLQSGGRT